MARNVSDPFAADDNATPLTADERAGLIPTHITLRHQLNEAEQANIVEAEGWAFGRRHRNLLSEEFICRLHGRMLGGVWRWAGTFRTTEKNIGVPPWQIRIDLRQLLDDAKAWREYNSYPRDEIAIRFKHRLVSIHPFANGNGRHSRIMGDLLIEELGGRRFTWGSSSLRHAGEVRKTYIDALHYADGGDIGPLIAFARS